jgi:sterol 14-demethylase
MLGFAIRQVNLDPALFPNPTDFDVDRFLEPRSEHKKAGRLFLLWGNGRHPCQGTRFANIEVRSLYTLSVI